MHSAGLYVINCFEENSILSFLDTDVITRDSFYKYGLILIATRISNHMPK